MAVDVKRAEEGLAELIALYRDAQKIIALQVKEAIKSGNIEQSIFRAEAGRKVMAELERLGYRGDPFARRVIENAWNEGDRSVLQALPSGDGTFSFDRINREALRQAQDALVELLETQRMTVAQQVTAMFRRAGLRSVSLGLMGARGSGRAVAKDLEERLAKKQITAFIDKAGRVWDMKNYTEMVARTATRQAVVDAQVLRMADQGIEYARVNNNGTACSICEPWEGQLVSLGSTDTSLKGEPATTLDAMPNGGPPFHPRCRHWLEPEATDFKEFLKGSD